ncbi:MAG: diguanylate cyclase, partial [Sneathiella sp.]|nr:diguanylate cyclase [Sneathiella sp.]
GVAQFANGESIDNLISRADTALYQAKDAGRDQVKIDIPDLAKSA